MGVNKGKQGGGAETKMLVIVNTESMGNKLVEFVFSV